MHLEEHLKKTGQTQGDFGKRLNPPASQGLVSQWCRGVTRITLQYALQIDAETGGEVTPQDCADMYIEPHLRGVPQGADAQKLREVQGPIGRMPPDASRHLT